MAAHGSTTAFRRKVIIIGCGIAGPALALFLKRAGIEAEIYEARETVEGYALSLSCNGVAVLKMLSLNSAAFAEGSAVSKWVMSNGKGRHLGGGPFTAGGLKSVFIKRAPLGRILSDEAEQQGIRIQWGKKLKHIEVTSAGVVTANFQDGTSASGDLLVGCDGVHSRTRQFVDPAVQPVYNGLVNTGGYSQGVNVPCTPETTHFIAGTRAFFGYHVTPTGYIYWFANVPQGVAIQTHTDEERRRYLLELFCVDQPFITDIIQAAETTFPEFLTYTLPTQPSSWHKGPIALVGDAAHAISPSSGQGAAMALEDAAVLAKCLRDIPVLEQALETYEQLRRERTEKMFDLGQRSDQGKFATTGVQRWIRDLTTPLFLKLFANPKASAWIYDFRINWDSLVETDRVHRTGAENG